MNTQDVQAKEIDLKVAKQKLVCAIEEINLKLMNLHYDYLAAEDTVQQATEERAAIIALIETASYNLSCTSSIQEGLSYAKTLIHTRGIQ